MVGKSSSGQRTGVLYLALAVLNVGGVLAAVLLCHSLVGSYRRSVETSRTWSRRAGAVSALASKATEANAPGNDVFESHDVRGERAKLRRLMVEYEGLYRSARADLSAMPAAQGASLLAPLDAAHASFVTMCAEAEAIFAAFERNAPEEAGRHMASMDRANAISSEHLALLTARESVLQQAVFSAQSAQADKQGRFAWGLAAVVGLLVAVVLYYGKVMNRAMAAAQAAIEARNADMKRLLDNAAQGFATIDLDGVLSKERSAAFTRLLGGGPDDRTLMDVLARVAPDAGRWLGLGLEGVREGFLPTEISLDQLPKRAVVGERHLAFEFRPIERDGALAALLCVVSDVTAEVAREKVEAEGREAVEVFERVMRDREGVTEMLLEAGEIVRTLTDPGEVHKLTVVEERRGLHTLKGNAGIFGLKTFAAVCHDMESASLERDAALEAGERATLREAWDRTVARMRKLLGDERAQLIAVDEREHAEIIDAVLNGAAPESIAQRLAAWRLESASQRLERMAEQAKKLAERLGKPAVTVQVEPNGVRLAKEHWSKLFTELVHVVRNAIDHGIESADERVAAGKAPVGNVTVRTSVKADRLHIEITDDGRGIDWERVRAKARERGLAAETHSDLVSALFVDGLSTRDEATETSGRGVGLAAVAATLQSLDGRVDVTTTPQEGTQFRFSLPYVDTEHAMRDFRRSQVIPQA